MKLFLELIKPSLKFFQPKVDGQIVKSSCPKA